MVVDAEGNEQVVEREKDPETGDYVPVQVVDDAGSTYVVDSEGNVEKVEGNQGAVADVNNQPQLQNQLIIEVVASLQESLENYLLNHGKGPLSDQELWQLQNLPEYVPQDPEMVQGITDYLPKIKNNTDAFWEGFSDQSKNQLLNLIEGKNSDKSLKEQLEENQWKEAKYIIGNKIVDDGLLAWFAGLTYQQKAAKVLRKHLKSQGIYDQVWIDEETKAKVNCKIYLADGATLEMTVDFLSFNDEEDLVDILVSQYKVPYWEAYDIEVEGWEKVVNWLRIQDAQIARQEGWAVAYSNFVADVVMAPYGAVHGWVTGEHWRTEQELVWWEHIIGIVDVIPGEALAKAGITYMVIKIGNKVFDFAKVTQATRNVIIAAKTAGLRMVINASNEIILYGKKGTQIIGKWTNGILQDIYWVYGGERILAKLAGVRYIINNGTVNDGVVEIVEIAGESGIRAVADATRINLSRGPTRFTPLRPSTGQPISAGWDHVVDGHFNRSLSNNRSIFEIGKKELGDILQSQTVIKAPLKALKGGQFVRIVDVGKTIGRASLNQDGNNTTWIKVFTDIKGNLITTYPIAKP